MSMETLYRLRCNSVTVCKAAGPAHTLMSDARHLAKAEGWDVGPHYTETRQRGRLTHHTDYCPGHAREGER